MDSGANYGDDNGWMVNPRPHLPAVVPFSRLPVVVPLPRRFAVPFWGLILLATVGSVIAGVLAATVWPWEYRTRPSRSVAMLPRGNEAPVSGNAEIPASSAAEVPQIESSPPNLNAAAPGPAGSSTTDVNVSRPAVAEPVTIAPAPVKPATAEPSAPAVSDACQVKPPGPQLVSRTPRTVLRSGEPASLDLTVDGAPDGAHLIICGFPAESVFSAGRALDENTWTIPASAIADTTIMPPRGFAGSMDLAVMLMNNDKSLADRRTVHLQWLPQTRPALPASMAPRSDSANLDSLLTYAAHLKSIGNLADARQIFSRVAQTGDPRGAFMLAETYDPISLAKHQLLPADSDLELARIWYRKAFDLGSRDALGRLERLTNW